MNETGLKFSSCRSCSQFSFRAVTQIRLLKFFTVRLQPFKKKKKTIAKKTDETLDVTLNVRVLN